MAIGRFGLQGILVDLHSMHIGHECISGLR